MKCLMETSCMKCQNLFSWKKKKKKKIKKNKKKSVFRLLKISPTMLSGKALTTTPEGH